METLACLNGELMPVERARVPVWDRGFLFGDAVYEVIRLYRGRCWLEVEHLARLERSLRAIEMPDADLRGLTDRMHRTIAASRVEEGTVYLHVTRGEAPRAHPFPDPPVRPTELIVVRPFDDGPSARLRETGGTLISQPDLRWKRCDIKSTNLLPNVLALEAAVRRGGQEAVLVDPRGVVTEATHTSVLWLRRGRLEGSPEGPGILPGTTRQLVHHLADQEGLPFAEAEVSLDDLKRADEVILVGTTTEVMPIIRVDATAIGDGTPGPIARRLQAAYRRAVEHWLASPPAGMGHVSRP